MMGNANRTKLLARAVEYLNVGKPEQALKQLGKVLRAFPGHPDALNLSGVAQMQQGRMDRATGLLQQAVKAAPGIALFQYNLATALFRAKRFEEARDQFRATLALDPHMTAAATNLGTVLSHLGEHAEAETLFRQVLGQRPDDLYARANLANAVMQLGRPREALREVKRVIAQAGRIPPELFLNLGAITIQLGDFRRAEQAYRDALKGMPDSSDAWVGLGHALVGNEKIGEAKQAYARALELGESPFKMHYLIARASLEGGNYQAAVAEYGALLGQCPDDVPLLLDAAQMEARLGDFAAQERHLLHVLDLDPGNSEALSQLASVPGRQVDDATLAQMEASAKNPDLSGQRRSSLAFALGDVLRGRGAYDEAFEYYALGNRLKGYVFDREELDRYVTMTIATFTPEFFRARTGWGNPTRTPVFIVGVPRSGTTLTEQILASHPAVFGAGERGGVVGLASSAEFPVPDLWEDPQRVAALSAADVTAFAENYLANMGASDHPVTYVTNKTPGNFLWLGLIALLFPNAAIIHTRRDPRDSLLSIYFKDFVSRHTYAYDLGDLGFYYRQYVRLMDHWERVLVNPYTAVDYEATVADQEGVARHLLDFLGLDWDERVLAFYETQRQVKTASQWQVRQPIYATSMQRWRRYERHLAPLIEALGDTVPAND